MRLLNLVRVLLWLLSSCSEAWAQQISDDVFDGQHQSSMIVIAEVQETHPWEGVGSFGEPDTFESTMVVLEKIRGDENLNGLNFTELSANRLMPGGPGIIPRLEAGEIGIWVLAYNRRQPPSLYSAVGNTQIGNAIFEDRRLGEFPFIQGRSEHYDTVVRLIRQRAREAQGLPPLSDEEMEQLEEALDQRVGDDRPESGADGSPAPAVNAHPSPAHQAGHAKEEEAERPSSQSISWPWLAGGLGGVILVILLLRAGRRGRSSGAPG